MAEPETFIDSPGARIVAGTIGAVCIGLLVFLNWHVMFPPPVKQGEDDAKLNPEYVKCRDARLVTVQKMKDDGVITDAQFTQFSARAEETCAGQFPPGG
ncbi:MAG: hypothetical protein AAGF81_05405 [Pseudomonadota bacterium]